MFQHKKEINIFMYFVIIIKCLDVSFNISEHINRFKIQKCIKCNVIYKSQYNNKKNVNIIIINKNFII